MPKSLLPVALFGLLSSMLVIGLSCERGDWPAVKTRIRGEFPRVAQMSVESLDLWLASGSRPSPVLLDVREEAEYRVSHLRGAIRVDPGSVPSLPPDVGKDAPIVTYCSVGYRSSAFADRLIEQGYTAVSNLEGSIFEWANKGHPLVRDGQAVRQVHPYDEEWSRLLDRRLRADTVE